MRQARALLALVMAIAAGIIMFLLTGCDWSAALPKGYELAHCADNYVVITHGPNNEGVINANVELYKVLSNAIVGYAGKAPAEAGPVKTGYFIIELQSGRVYQGMNKKQWLAQLRKISIGKEPQLEKP